MNNSAESKEFSPASEMLCRHHWILESPKDAVTVGVCKNCGETKTFTADVRVSFVGAIPEKLARRNDRRRKQPPDFPILG